jgi:REP element-mobilizing transposase RayT
MRERKRTRLIGFDYATPGAYFITTVVKDRLCVFGKIRNGTCLLNPFGQIVEEQWRWLHDQYLYLTMDEFVVMPNHVHGIINIADCPDNRSVGDGRDRSLQKIKSLSELIGAFKTTSSKRIHKSGLPAFRWQKSFYERIVRNDQELQRIQEYIHSNPLTWERDIENSRDFNVGDGRDRSLKNQSTGNRSVQDYYDKIIAPR